MFKKRKSDGLQLNCIDVKILFAWQNDYIYLDPCVLETCQYLILKFHVQEVKQSMMHTNNPKCHFL